MGKVHRALCPRLLLAVMTTTDMAALTILRSIQLAMTPASMNYLRYNITPCYLACASNGKNKKSSVYLHQSRKKRTLVTENDVYNLSSYNYHKQHLTSITSPTGETKLRYVPKTALFPSWALYLTWALCPTLPYISTETGHQKSKDAHLSWQPK